VDNPTIDFLKLGHARGTMIDQLAKRPKTKFLQEFPRMNKNKTAIRVTLIVVIAIAVITAVASFYGERIAGQFMAWQETQRLQAAGADPNYINPSAQSDSFSGELSPVWAFEISNGAGLIGHTLQFHNSSISLKNGLTISQYFDPAFDQESLAVEQPASPRYNNASLIGFQGYQPTPGEDVLFQARMQVSSNFYGSAGFMLQPQGTLLADGSFQGRFNNQAFTLFGICFIGPESNLFGKKGATVEKVINWWPDEIQGLDVDMHEPHTYLLRLHWVDEHSWIGTVFVDGQVVSTMSLPPLGPVEVQIWSDNYAMDTSISGIPMIGYQNGETKWIRFQEISVRPDIGQ